MKLILIWLPGRQQKSSFLQMSGYSFEPSNHRYLLGAFTFHLVLLQLCCCSKEMFKSPSLGFPLPAEKPLMWEFQPNSDTADHHWMMVAQGHLRDTTLEVNGHTDHRPPLSPAAAVSWPNNRLVAVNSALSLRLTHHVEFQLHVEDPPAVQNRHQVDGEDGGSVRGDRYVWPEEDVEVHGEGVQLVA